MDIGKIGAFAFLDGMTTAESIAFCRRVERLGYKVFWTPEAWGREPFAHAGYLLSGTDRLIASSPTRAASRYIFVEPSLRLRRHNASFNFFAIVATCSP